MTKLTLARPSVGEKNTAAEPKVDTALAAIETWANGEVGTENITVGSVTEAMLATAVQEKLGGTIFGLTHKASAISASVANGELLQLTGAGTTATLPAATKGRVCGVYASASGVKVKTAAGVIAGDFLTGQATIELRLNQHVVLEAEGTNWLIVAGEPWFGKSWGVVSSSGSILAGSGDFTCAQAGTGLYEIKWTTPRASLNYSVIGSTGSGIFTAIPEPGTVTVNTYTPTGSLLNARFAFQAQGLG
jgi:hypothetical protein